MASSKNQTMRCANCGHAGHVYKKCTEPITSYGIICIQQMQLPMFLMVRRKDSLAYVEFLRGKYTLNNKTYITKLISHMTFAEQGRLMNHSFGILWRWLWQINDCMNFRREYENANMKFEQLKRGYSIVGAKDEEFVNLQNLLLAATCKGEGFPETEWGFAKGRRNIGESDFECATREFYEETGMPKAVNLQMDAETIEETFIGSNGLKYKHVYYVAKVVGCERITFSFAPNREVGAVSWFTYEDAQKRIRDYNPERKNIVRLLNTRL